MSMVNFPFGEILALTKSNIAVSVKMTAKKATTVMNKIDPILLNF
jgi:hypothetical protein